MKKLPLILSLFALNGCLSAVPVGPVAPANHAQVIACETDESVHNVMVISGVTLGAGTSVLGSGEAASSDNTTKKNLAIGTIITGAVAVVVTAIAGIEAADYSNSGCPALLGPLPVAKPNTEK